MWRTLPGMATRLVLNRVVQGRSSTACTRLGSNRWMVSVLSRVLGLCMSMCSGGQSLLTVPVLSMICLSSPSVKSSSSLSSSLSGVIVSVITSTRHLPSSRPVTVNPYVFVVVMCVHPCLVCVCKVCTVRVTKSFHFSKHATVQR